MSNDIVEDLSDLTLSDKKLGNFSYDVDGKSLVYYCNVAGFRSDELQLKWEKNELVITGEHKDKSDGQSVHQFLTRRVTVPDVIIKSTVKCCINEIGRLEVIGTTCLTPAPFRRNILIESEHTDEKVKDKPIDILYEMYKSYEPIKKTVEKELKHGPTKDSGDEVKDKPTKDTGDEVKNKPTMKKSTSPDDWSLL